MFSRKISVGNDLYDKLKQCSESAGYATPEEFANHVLEKEIEGMLFGVQAEDPVTFLAMSAILLLVAALASLTPALRILRIDPAKTLRGE